MTENCAGTNFPLSIFTEGAPVYEQKELRKQRRMPQARFPLKGTLCSANGTAERTVDFALKVISN